MTDNSPPATPGHRGGGPFLHDLPGQGCSRRTVFAGAMAAVVGILPALGGLAELVLDAGTGAVVYAVMVLMLNAAGVRDVARRLLARRQDAPA